MVLSIIRASVPSSINLRVTVLHRYSQGPTLIYIIPCIFFLFLKRMYIPGNTLTVLVHISLVWSPAHFVFTKFSYYYCYSLSVSVLYFWLICVCVCVCVCVCIPPWYYLLRSHPSRITGFKHLQTVWSVLLASSREPLVSVSQPWGHRCTTLRFLLTFT